MEKTSTERILSTPGRLLEMRGATTLKPGKTIHASETAHGKWLLVDLRSSSERATGYIAGSEHIPMESLPAMAERLQRRHRTLVLVCQSGQRARTAQETLARLQIDSVVLEDGIHGWKKAGLPVSRKTSSRWSIERQVRLIAGLLVLLGAILSVVLDRHWVLLCAFIGAGLSFAGASDTCLLAHGLELLPWNRPQEY